MGRRVVPHPYRTPSTTPCVHYPNAYFFVDGRTRCLDCGLVLTVPCWACDGNPPDDGCPSYHCGVCNDTGRYA